MSDLSFSGRAWRSILLAQELAARRQNIYIGPEDLLLGILTEGENPAADFLCSHGIDVAVFTRFLKRAASLSHPQSDPKGHK